MDPHPNLAYTTVTTPPVPALSGTSLNVAAGTGARFGWTGNPFNATVWPTGVRPTPVNAEIVRVTNIAGDTLTITRAQEGTVARAIIAGDQIAATVTAKVLTDIEQRTFITVDPEAQLPNARALVAGTGITLDITVPGVIGIAASGAGNTLAAEILADLPRGFWTCSDASGGFQDSSGNGFHLTTLVGSLNYRFGHLMGPLPTTSFAQNPDLSTERHASRATDLGITRPWTGDLTCEAVVNRQSLVGGNVFSQSASGETEAANFQFSLGLTAAGLLRAFWEQGAGVNEDVVSGIPLVSGLTYHIAAVKRATPNFVDFYVNGRCVAKIAYTNEPSGGSSTAAHVGGDVAGAVDNWNGGFGYVALYNSALSADRIMAHAVAAGLA